MDITDQILDQIRLRGASDNTAPATLGYSRSLNYAKGATLVKAETTRITAIPYIVPFKDAVGLGADNYYMRFNVDVLAPTFACFEEFGWECARVSYKDENYDPSSSYEQAVIGLADDPVLNDYYPAQFSDNTFSSTDAPKMSVRLINKKTGNQYIDRDFDVNFITKNKHAVQEEKLWCNLRDHFYVSFHARNTKRIPYDVDVVIGEEVINEADLNLEGAVLNSR